MNIIYESLLCSEEISLKSVLRAEQEIKYELSFLFKMCLKLNILFRLMLSGNDLNCNKQHVEGEFNCAT